ncbi:MAG: GGDEF domain-containing protein [Proteobacteria bacterium]|nr:GGDEF domain-containing protein [Pseudomonadota bacterium]
MASQLEQLNLVKDPIMALPNPTKPMSILVVSPSFSDGNLLRYGLQDALGKFLSLVDVAQDLPGGAEMFKATHHDIVIAHGWTGAQSEAFVLRVRREDGRRHTGIIVMADTSDGFDKLVVDNYNAGADEVVPSNLSLAILRSKIIMVFNYKVTTDLLRTANHKLQAMAVTDELTGCANMRGFTRKFAASMLECAKGAVGVAVMMMDLDHFKKVNDTHNHLVGSSVIRATGQLLLNSGILEKIDTAARYGGDEFVVLFQGYDSAHQVAKALRLCEAIRQNEYIYDQVKVRITASIGLAWAAPGFKGLSSDLVKSADAMLYRSKEMGRNQVNAMDLKYPIDFSNIAETHLIKLPNRLGFNV